MATKTIDVDTTQMSVQELAALMETDTEVHLTKAGLLIARVMPLPRQVGKRTAGLHAHLGPGQMGEDFNDELPDEFWFGGDAAGR